MVVSDGEISHTSVPAARKATARPHNDLWLCLLHLQQTNKSLFSSQVENEVVITLNYHINIYFLATIHN